MSTKTPFLDVHSISASYGSQSSASKRVDVVKNMSFGLAEGSLGCILGPSGCGKTTILRAISGFQEVSSGSITLDGKILANQKQSVEAEKRQVGMVFQDLALFPHLTIAQNIRFGLTKLSTSEQLKEVDTMLELIGMQGLGDNYPHELSGGQSQRVALARAIAPRPKLLLMDEPFSNLDAELRESLGYEVRALLKELGITAIMVTHDQNDAFALGDQIGVMSEGRLLQWDSPFDLYHAPKSQFVARFIGDGVLVKGKMIAENVVATPFGKIRGQLVNNHSVDDDLEILIRPDDVKYDSNSAIRGKVMHRAFKGAQTLYTIQIKSGDQIMSLAPSHDDFEIGDVFGISIETDHLICFPQDDR